MQILAVDAPRKPESESGGWEDEREYAAMAVEHWLGQTGVEDPSLLRIPLAESGRSHGGGSRRST